ncbi:MAG: FtsW/RodA/SpoVE family cell cycle protein [Planctomycetota bacterium]|jgi:cell division protein FtsW (lipid II flippase)|nr:FtsW/RodA/SpoVE family cell cycle protein [Planctomycetota bacterium]
MGRIDPWRVDWIFLLAALAIIALGLPFLNSSAGPGDFMKQIVWVTLGLAGLGFFALCDYHWLVERAHWIFIASTALLGAALLAPPINNAHRFLRLGPIGVQPSEPFKLALILFLARYLGENADLRRARGLIFPFLLTLGPMCLILKQPDLGTALTLPPILLTALWVSGARFSHLAATILLGLASAWPMWEYGLRSYQKTRIYAFLDPERYASAEAYQLLMSLSAIGASGIFGQGLGNGVITELSLLPEIHNDFIFGVVAEEGGLAAAGSMTLLFLILVLIGLHVSANAPDRQGRIVAAGVSAIIGWQACLNIYVVTGMLPTTGVTLPLVSYGGSSMVVTCAMVGMVLNVSQAAPTLDKLENPDRI